VRRGGAPEGEAVQSDLERVTLSTLHFAVEHDAGKKTGRKAQKALCRPPCYGIL
jgi:hypothetical protein